MRALALRLQGIETRAKGRAKKGKGRNIYNKILYELLFHSNLS